MLRIITTLLIAAILCPALANNIQRRDGNIYTGTHDGMNYVVTVTCSGGTSSTRTEYSRNQGARFASNTMFINGNGTKTTETTYDENALAIQWSSSYINRSEGYGSIMTNTGTTTHVLTAFNDQ